MLKYTEMLVLFLTQNLIIRINWWCLCILVQNQMMMSLYYFCGCNGHISFRIPSMAHVMFVRPFAGLKFWSTEFAQNHCSSNWCNSQASITTERETRVGIIRKNTNGHHQLNRLTTDLPNHSLSSLTPVDHMQTMRYDSEHELRWINLCSQVTPHPPKISRTSRERGPING